MPRAAPTLEQLKRSRHAPMPQLRTRQADHRPSARHRGYTTSWDKMSRHYRRHHPLCERCEHHGQVTPAAEVHHVDGDPGNNDWGNLEALCISCHNRTKR